MDAIRHIDPVLTSVKQNSKLIRNLIENQALTSNQVVKAGKNKKN